MRRLRGDGGGRERRQALKHLEEKVNGGRRRSGGRRNAGEEMGV